MMGVDQARYDDMPFEIEDFIGSGWQFASLAHFFNEAVSYEKTTVGNFPLVVVHGEDVCVFDEESCHGVVE
jgi:hypothetical protein